MVEIVCVRAMRKKERERKSEKRGRGGSEEDRDLECGDAST